MVHIIDVVRAHVYAAAAVVEEPVHPSITGSGG